MFRLLFLSENVERAKRCRVVLEPVIRRYETNLRIVHSNTVFGDFVGEGFSVDAQYGGRLPPHAPCPAQNKGDIFFFEIL